MAKISGKIMENGKYLGLNLKKDPTLREQWNDLKRISEKIINYSHYDFLERMFAAIMEEKRKRALRRSGRRIDNLSLTKRMHQIIDESTEDWWDHLSCHYLPDQKERIMIIEPYELSKKEIKDLIRVTDDLGLDFNIDVQYSTHFPGSTMRISIPIKNSKK